MTTTYEAYNSTIHVLELDSIPETGDEMFSVGSHPIIVWNSMIDIQKHLVSEWLPQTPKNRGAIGVLGTKTVLVDVEYNEESRGLTIRELAQFMLNVLGCKTACVTPWEPIIVHTAYEEEAPITVYESDNRFPLPLTVDVIDETLTVEAAKPKRKKKVTKDAETE